MGMKIHTKATNMEMTPAIQAYIDKKIGALEKFLKDEPAARADVEVQVTSRHQHDSHDHFRAEVNLFAGAITLRAEASDHDLYAAIDIVKDEITRQLVSVKKKKQGLMRRGGQRIKDILRGFGGQK